MAISYSERPPSPALRDFVDCYWDFRLAHDGGGHEHIVPPDGSVTLSGARSPEGHCFAMLVGPSTKAQTVWVQPHWHYAGIRLLPGTAKALLGVETAQLRDKAVPVATLPASTRDWCEHLAGALFEPPAADALLLGRLPVPMCDEAVLSAVAAIRHSNGSISVAALAAEQGLSERQLRRRFRLATGLSPKEYARIVQLRHACILAVSSPERPWSAVSAEAGYADQPHLVRAIAKSFGLTPVQVGAYLRQITHDFAGADVRKDQDSGTVAR